MVFIFLHSQGTQPCNYMYSIEQEYGWKKTSRIWRKQMCCKKLFFLLLLKQYSSSFNSLHAPRHTLQNSQKNTATRILTLKPFHMVMTNFWDLSHIKHFSTYQNNNVLQNYHIKLGFCLLNQNIKFILVAIILLHIHPLTLILNCIYVQL